MADKSSLAAFLKELYLTRVWLLLLVRMITYAGLFVSLPYIQTEATEYFARKHTDEDIRCTGNRHEGGFDGHRDQPKACIQAHDDVLLWTTGKTIFNAVTVSLFLNPAVGTWSDMFGRKPFLIFSTVAQLVPIGTVYLYLKLGLPLELYYPALILGQPFSSQSVMLAYVADVITPEHRLMAFGLLSLMFSVGIILGTGASMGGAVNDLETAALIGLITIVTATVVLICFIPESLTKEVQQHARDEVREKQRDNDCRSNLGFCWESFASAMKILWRTMFFRKLVVILFLTMLVAEEYVDFRTQFLQEILGFGTKEQTYMMMIMGISGFLIMTVGLYIVSVWLKMTDKQILLLGTSMMCISYGLLASAHWPWMAYLSTVLVSFWMFLGMAISSMKSKNVEESEQGAVQGALTAISSLGFGLGPLLFYALYYAFRNGAIYFPPATFYFGFLTMIVAVLIATTLEAPASMERQKSEVLMTVPEEKRPLMAGGDENDV